MTQKEKILNYMKEHGSITQRDAYTFGCYRLGARIFDLAKDGVAIDREMQRVTNADGSKTYVARYRLAKGD